MSSTGGGKISTRSERLRHSKAVFDKRNSANEKNARAARDNGLSLDTTMIDLVWAKQAPANSVKE
jgi:hypothetical protein